MCLCRLHSGFGVPCPSMCEPYPGPWNQQGDGVLRTAVGVSHLADVAGLRSRQAPESLVSQYLVSQMLVDQSSDTAESTTPAKESVQLPSSDVSLLRCQLYI